MSEPKEEREKEERTLFKEFYRIILTKEGFTFDENEGFKKENGGIEEGDFTEDDFCNLDGNASKYPEQIVSFINHVNSTYSNMHGIENKEDTKEIIECYIDYVKYISPLDDYYSPKQVTPRRYNNIFNVGAELKNGERLEAQWGKIIDKYKNDIENLNKDIENQEKKEQLIQKKSKITNNSKNINSYRDSEENMIINFSQGISKSLQEMINKFSSIINEEKNTESLTFVNNRGQARKENYDLNVHTTTKGALRDYVWIKLKEEGDVSHTSISITIGASECKVSLMREDKSSDIEIAKLNKCSSMDSLNNCGKEYDNNNQGKIKCIYKKICERDDKGEIRFLKDNNIGNAIKQLVQGYKTIKKIDPSRKKIEEEVVSGNKQIILTGAPGTGKTYCAKDYAKEFNGDIKGYFVQFHPSYDYTDFVEGIRPIQIEGKEGKEEKEEKAGMQFVKLDGIFKKFCRQVAEKNKVNNISWDEIAELDDKCIRDNNLENFIQERIKLDDEEDADAGASGNAGKVGADAGASGNADKVGEDSDSNYNNYKNIKEYIQYRKNLMNNQYCFVIDEVNRADISKVFGELMYALEYRGIKNRQPTQYQNLLTYDLDAKKEYGKDEDCFFDGFFIPENVIIIGTMNDIDKSVESFDFAMRRRFRWPEIKVEEVLKPTLTMMFGREQSTKEEINELENYGTAIFIRGILYWTSIF